MKKMDYLRNGLRYCQLAVITALLLYATTGISQETKTDENTDTNSETKESRRLEKGERYFDKEERRGRLKRIMRERLNNDDQSENGIKRRRPGGVQGQGPGQRQGQGAINEDNSSGPLARFPRIRQLIDSMPEEQRQKLKQLHQEDPEKFREEMRKQIMNWKNKYDDKKSNSTSIRQLRQSYLRTTDTKEKEEIRKKLKKELENEFDLRMEENRKKLEQLEKKVEDLRDQFDKRKSHRDEIVEEQLKKITQNPNMNW